MQHPWNLFDNLRHLRERIHDEVIEGEGEKASSEARTVEVKFFVENAVLQPLIYLLLRNATPNPQGASDNTGWDKMRKFSEAFVWTTEVSCVLLENLAEEGTGVVNGTLQGKQK